MFFADSFHAGIQQSLGITDADLADRIADAGHGSFKQGFCPVSGQFEELFCLAGVTVDEIEALLRGDADFHGFHIFYLIINLLRHPGREISANGLIKDGIEPVLFLRDDAFILN